MSVSSPSSNRLPIAVLVSGEGTNLQALLDTVHGREAMIVAVASNTADAPALRRAVAKGVQTAVFRRTDYPDRKSRDEAMAEWLQGRGARLVVLAGFMELLSGRFLDRFPGSVINVHPSLLPSYPGLHPIERALADHAETFGVTVHYVDEGVDTGPIILQDSLRLAHASDPAEVLRALRPLEHALLPEAVRQIAAQRPLIAA
ncbi:MAG TPA: phosphoribosylglycinamide formyltransferase [Solirubrobacteraceae bacterium]|jgi:phosphoribosylglycinamide formyltransferase 1|nr:phosphoribosylglycinamide formyltransferase [Solirubrobacteraceae bacterium]